jgi:hypothetical protein
VAQWPPAKVDATISDGSIFIRHTSLISSHPVSMIGLPQTHVRRPNHISRELESTPSPSGPQWADLTKAPFSSFLCVILEPLPEYPL